MGDISYIAVKPKEAVRLMKTFDRNAKIARRGLLPYVDSDAVDTVIGEARNEYERLIPEIPYIGEKNIFMRHLLFASQGLALYRTLRKRNMTVEEIGKILCTMVELHAYRMPWMLRKIVGRLMFSGLMIEKYKKTAEGSRKREFPGNWVCTFVQGDGTGFDYGFDIHECGLLKFFRAQGAEDVVPYLCATDYIVSRAIGEGLMRTMNLARGGDKCDFRFRRKGEENPEWIPDFFDPDFRVLR